MGKLWTRAAEFTASPGRTAGGLIFIFSLAVGLAASAQEWTGRFPRIDVLPSIDDRSGPSRPIPEATTPASQPPIVIDPRPPVRRDDLWYLQLLPDGLIYRSYLAGVKESRFASAWVHEPNLGRIWDIALGGRVGILRYGTQDVVRPEGWQLDIEGAGFPRLDLEHARDLVSVDFRFGIPLTYGNERFQTKLAFYHLCSHLGDELLIRNPTARRINFVRDVLVWGNSFYWTPDLRLYAEVGWASSTDGGSKPWEFQFGVDYSPAGPSRRRGAPFFAFNGHLREEVDFGGNLVVQTGWQWRGSTGHLFRMGMQYYCGMSEQYQFYEQYEDKLGLAMWYDY